ncbi:MAG: Nif3-like dinuclear metal center hexameric protein [Selenomonadales bacterium]|nr:Nif3-like dinuclear metal center hexameric protein [Selenomonadales bacterium]
MLAAVKDVIRILNEIAPPSLAEEWDNVGLMVGRTDEPVRVILCALDYSAEVLAQARELRANLIVTHHPAIFKGIRHLTDEDWHTSLLLDAARENIAVFSAHTNLDSAIGGINDVLAELLGLDGVETLCEQAGTLAGIGRVGVLPEPKEVAVFADTVREKLGLPRITYAPAGAMVRKVAVCSGAGMDFLDAALRSGADTYVTGDVKYHEAQDAVGKGINVIDGTHQATELIMMNHLADRLALRLSRDSYATRVLVAKETPLFRVL